jgi:hypothetical protein
MKKYLLFVFLINFLVSSSQTIITSAPVQTSMCAGGNIVVEYQTTGTFNLNCTFTAQLSDNWGNFSNPVNIGSMPFNTGVILGTIPLNTTLGINYRVRVISDNPAVIGSESPNPPIIIASTAVTATIVTDPGNVICQGQTTNLWVTPNASYYWSNGATTQSLDVSQSGTYNVTVTNYLTGCEVSSTPVTITVNPLPYVDLGNDTAICDGQQVVLDAGNGYTNYSWNGGAYHSQSVTITQTGIWNVTVTDVNNCSNKDSINIIVNPNPVVEFGDDTTFCGTHLYLNAGSGFASYNWNNGLSFNPILDITLSGTYIVWVEDINNCTTSDTLVVTVNQPPVLNLGNDLMVCGNSAVLNAGSGFSGYNWNNGQGIHQLFPVSQSGSYTLDVTATNGCHGYDTILVSLNHLPTVNLGLDFQLLTTNWVVLDAGSGYEEYLWNNGSTGQTLNVNGWDYTPGVYNFFVTVIDSNGCFNTDEIVITITESINISENVIDKVKIYPNPFFKTFYIEFNNTIPNGTPTLIDESGKKVIPYFEKITTGWKINCSDFAPGMYSILLENQESVISCGKVIAK